MSNAALAAYATAERQRRRRYAQKTEALFSRMTAVPEFSVRQHLDVFMRGLLDIGMLDICDGFYVIAKADAQSSYLNWAADAYNLTPSDPAPTFSPFAGVTPNGVSSYLDTGFNPATAVGAKFGRYAAHMGSWHLTDSVNAGANSYDIGNTNSMMIKLSTLSTMVRPNQLADASVATTNGGFATHKVWTRNSDALWKFYRRGVMSHSGTNPTLALTSFNFGIGRTSATTFGVNTCTLYHFGGLPNEKQIELLHLYAGRLFKSLGTI